MGSNFTTYSFTELLSNIVDNRGKTCPIDEEGLPLIATNCVKNDTLYPVFEKIRYVNQETYDTWFRGHPEPGDLIFVCKGSPGNVCRTPDPVNFCIAQDMVAIRANEKIVDPKYLFALLRSPITQAKILNMHVGTLIPHFKKGDFKNLNFDIPNDRGIQKAIGSIYLLLSEKIELNRQMNATLEGMAQALFKSWFVDFDPVIDKALAAGHPIPEPLHKRAEARRALGEKRKQLPAAVEQHFPSRFVFCEELGWGPEGWGVVPFGSLIESTIGGDWGKEEEDEKHGLCVAIIRGTDIPSAKAGIRGKAPLRWVEQKKFTTRELADGDIVLEVSGGSPKQPTGRSVYLTGNYLDLLGGPVAPASFCRKLRPKSSLLGLYASLHLDRIYSAGKMWGYQNQSTGISNFQTMSFLENEALVLPDQDAVLEFFYHTVRPLVDKMMTHEKEHLANLRDTLLPKLLSGELRIPDAEKLIAENQTTSVNYGKEAAE